MKIPPKLDLPVIPTPSASELAQEFTKAIPRGQESGPSTEGAAPPQATIMKAMISCANQTWRIASAVIDQESKEAKEELKPQEIRKVAKAIESLMETFESLGLRVIDRLGEPFNPGLPDQVVTEEPREGLVRDQIIRTIRPTIVWNDAMVQRGEVDIAVPANKL